MGDGYCDDFMNNKNCDYDGGDCCLSDIKKDYCNECLCLEGGNSTNTTTGSPEGKFKTILLFVCWCLHSLI